MSAESTPALLERIFREEQGRVVATLIGQCGDIDVAEEALQEAFLVATEQWPDRGVVRLDRSPEAADAYDRALELVGNDTERQFLEERRALLGTGIPPLVVTGGVPREVSAVELL